jgi:hypothetical protein
MLHLAGFGRRVKMYLSLRRPSLSEHETFEGVLALYPSTTTELPFT